MTRLERIRGCFLLGACGDTLGAPLEGIRSLDKIIEKFGPAGLSDIVEFRDAYGKGIDYPPGRVTDDTTMAMTTAAAMLLTSLAPRPGLADDLRPLMWQGYINWVRFQDDGAALAHKIDPAVKWPALARDFWFACGAGAGTIAALTQDGPGTVSAPHVYECTVRGKKISSPNAGCGGMMRVAPLAFLEGLGPEEIFKIGCDNAAVTHGHPAAFVATGAVALYVHFAARGLEMKDILDETENVLRAFETRPEYAAGVKECLGAMNHARQRAAAPASLHIIDALPGELGHKNPFLAVPVLAQVAYALSGAKDITSAKSTLILSVNHSGDSDSVGAIVGNILGAKYGDSAVPPEWLDILLQREKIEEMANDLDRALSAPVKRNLKPAP